MRLRSFSRIALVAAGLMLAPAAAWPAVISIGLYPPDPVQPFLVPIVITDGVGVRAWEFDLTYNPSVVRVNDPPALDFFSYTTPGDFFGDGFHVLNPGFIILEGFPLAQAGRLAFIQGLYGGFDPPPSGSGVLAYVEFIFVCATTADGCDSENPGDPGIDLDRPSVDQAPEPATVALVAAGAAMLLGSRRARRRAGR